MSDAIEVMARAHCKRRKLTPDASWGLCVGDARADIAALTAAGYAVVPVEPTIQTLDAMRTALRSPLPDYITLYRAMIAAAKEPRHD